jgi:hypothetical protein
MREEQSSGAVLMLRPACFGFNAETAASNSFQSDAGYGQNVQSLALTEFEGLAQRLARAGIDVHIAQDSLEPSKPDAVFPNNWVSFHSDGTVVLYPMMAPNRRTERRAEILTDLAHDADFRVTRVLDLSSHESEGKYLEGTGSVVLDRVHRFAFACLSPRTDLGVLGDFSQQLDYELVAFEARGGNGSPLYHTNVMMAIGSKFAVVCGASIADRVRRGAIFNLLRDTGHEVIDISTAQMQAFAGNLLELAAPGGAVIALSAAAWSSLEPAQRKRLEQHGSIVAAPIPTIERVGGGSVRCMLAEIHLPRAASALMA